MQTKLKSIQLAGYKSYNNNFEKNRIDFEDINIIIGANGAGKSNLISFLELIAYIATSGLQRYVSDQGSASSLLYYGPKETDQIMGRLEIEAEGGQKQDIYEFSLSSSVDDRLYFARETIRYSDSRYYSTPYEKTFRNGSFETSISDTGTDTTLRMLLKYLGSFKVFHFNDTSINSRIRRQGFVDDSNYLRSDAGNLAAFLYRLKTNPAYHNNYQRIIRFIQTVFPQLDDFVLTPNLYGDNNVRLNWKTKNSDVVFGPHQLSDGSLRFAALATLLLQPADTMPLAIVLDEPEIGLHPYAISQLVRMIHMAGKTSQVIVSTQSPILLNEFSYKEVIVAEYNSKAGHSTLKKLSEEGLSDWLKEYTLGELWEKNVLGGLPI